MEARISLVYQDKRQARAVSEAVSPDNTKTPENLSVETFTDDSCRVLASIEYRGDNLITFLSTIDDLLRCISVAEKAFLRQG